MRFPLTRAGRAGLLATTALCGALYGANVGAQPPVNALPTNGTVSAGQASIAANGNQMTITQGTDRAAINWGSYNIGANAGVTYVQPGAGSIALNRVLGNDASQIFGRLTANGQVWLVNPNGILFGRSARIDVAGLVAATSNITDNEFMTGNGRFRFDQPGRPDAAIVNEGQITVREAGLAAFVAPAVRNSGVITASLGTVALGAGTTFTLDLYGDRLVNLSVDPVTQNAIDAEGRPVRAGVENSGRIMADGGRVQVTANVARGVVDNVIRMSGEIEARAARVEGGSIVLDGGTGGVEVTGTMDVSARAPGQRGGRVQVTGERVRIAPTVTIDASGDAGGGTIEIGGGYRGGGPLPHARSVTVEAGARLVADALTNGRGGTVVVWSDGDTTFNGAISVRGGAAGGNGGIVETSGHTLSIAGTASVDLSAPAGQGGSWLLDPDSLEVIGAAGTCATVALCNGGSGAQTVQNSVIVSALDTGDVTLSATNSITINATIDAHTNPNGHDLTFNTVDFHLNATIWLSNLGPSNLVINNTGVFTRGSSSAGLIAQGTITVHQNNGASIQAVNDALAAGDYSSATVIVGPGTYAPFTVTSGSVEYRGARADKDPTNLDATTGRDPATNTIIDANYQDRPGIWIQENHVTVNGFTVINSLQAGIRVGRGASGATGPIDGTLIANNYIYGNGNGILFQDAPRFSGGGLAACESWCGEGSYAPGRFTNTIIDRNRIEQNNLVRGHIAFSGETSFPVIEQRAGNHGIVFAGNTENTLVSRNYILSNNGHGIFIAGSSYDPFDDHPIGTTPALNHANMAIVANRIENPGQTGIQVGRDYFYDSIFGYVGNGGTNGYNGTVSGLAIVLNTISGAFNCAGEGSTCQATVWLGKGGTTTADYSAPPVDLRGAINFDNVTLEAVGDCLCTVSATPSDTSSNFISFLLGQGISLLGTGITTADLAEAFDGGAAPSTYIGYNLITGAGYGVSIHSTVNLGGSVVYINNNNLDQNAKGGLLYALTASGGGSGYGCDVGGCYTYETGRVIAAGNYWGARQNQGGEGSPGNMDPVFGNMGPTFTLDVFDNTAFRADIQGTGALPTYQYFNSDYGSGPYGWYRVPAPISLYGSSGAQGGVIVSSWRIDGNNQIGRLNEFLVNAQATINPQAETPPTYPFPITLVIGGQFAGYLPTNFVRVDDLTQYLLTGSYPEGAGPSFVPGGFDVFRGPGAFDPSGRITRGVSSIREPLPLLATLVGVTLSPGASDNGAVDVLPGNYLYEGGFGARAYEGNPDGTSGLVLIDKDNLTIQATLYGVSTPTTPAGLIPGTAPGWSYNPDRFDGTLNGRGFQNPDPVNGIPTRTGPGNSPRTLDDQTEAVLWGGIAVVPNVIRGLIGAWAQFGGEGGPEAVAQAFLNTAPTNQVTISGMTIVNGFRLGQLDDLIGSPGFSFGRPDMYVGVLIASGQNHVLRNNTIINCVRCSPPDSEEKSATPAGYGGEGSIGVWIAPGDALLANAFTGSTSEGPPLPQAPATGSGTQILQNNIFGWNTAGIMIDFPTAGSDGAGVSAAAGFTAPTGIEIRRNTIAQTCTYGCFFGGSPDSLVIEFFGGAGIVIGRGVGVTITNNWFRDNEIGIFNNSTTVQIVENQFRSRLSTERSALGDLPAILTTESLVGASNWFDANQTHVGFTNLTPAPDEFDHDPLLPGWQLFVPSPPTPPGVTPAAPPAPVVVTFPSFARIPADGPFAFLANPFLLQLILGGGGGPSLGEIAPAAGGTPGDPCAGQTPEQIANSFLGGTLLGNVGGGYQQAVTCSAQ